MHLPLSLHFFTFGMHTNEGRHESWSNFRICQDRKSMPNTETFLPRRTSSDTHAHSLLFFASLFLAFLAFQQSSDVIPQAGNAHLWKIILQFPEASIFHCSTDGREKGRTRHSCERRKNPSIPLREGEFRFSSLHMCHRCPFLCVCVCVNDVVTFWNLCICTHESHSPARNHCFCRATARAFGDLKEDVHRLAHMQTLGAENGRCVTKDEILPFF